VDLKAYNPEAKLIVVARSVVLPQGYVQISDSNSRETAATIF
jgi:hypothetical protein